MNTYAPNYYTKFKCIADKCRHSCCIGWEIDIDSDTLSYYNSLKGEITDKIKASISYDGEPHFILQKGDRCPFLKENGLCELICTLGENSLCNICADHPRFRNYYSDSLEIGLGLCCEAAAQLILCSEESFEIIRLEENEESSFDENESYVLNRRNKFIEIMKDRTKSIEERHQALLNDIGEKIPLKSVTEWCDFFLELERLDESWTDVLNFTKNHGLPVLYLANDEECQLPLEQLTIYFLYRHVPSAVYDGDIASRVKLAVFSTKLIYTLTKLKSSVNNEDFDIVFKDLCRMFSSEIEYSDENLEKLLDELF